MEHNWFHLYRLWGLVVEREVVACLEWTVTGLFRFFPPLMCLIFKNFIFIITLSSSFVSFSCRKRFFRFSCCHLRKNGAYWPHLTLKLAVLWVGSWTIWPPEVPYNLNILWLNILFTVFNAMVWKLLAGLRFGSCGWDTRLWFLSSPPPPLLFQIED